LIVNTVKAKTVLNAQCELFIKNRCYFKNTGVQRWDRYCFDKAVD